MLSCTCSRLNVSPHGVPAVDLCSSLPSSGWLKQGHAHVIPNLPAPHQHPTGRAAQPVADSSTCLQSENARMKAQATELTELVTMAMTQQAELSEAVERVQGLAMSSAMTSGREMAGLGDSIQRLEGMAMAAAMGVAKLTKKQSNDHAGSEAMLMQASMNASKFEKSVGGRTAGIESMLLSQAHTVAKLSTAVTCLVDSVPSTPPQTPETGDQLPAHTRLNEITTER